jgi:hypothetical protein
VFARWRKGHEPKLREINEGHVKHAKVHAEELTNLKYALTVGALICHFCRRSFCSDLFDIDPRLSAAPKLAPKKSAAGAELRPARERRPVTLGDDDGDDGGQMEVSSDSDSDNEDADYDPDYDASDDSSDGEDSGSDASVDDIDSEDEWVGDMGHAPGTAEQVAEIVFTDAFFHRVRQTHEQLFTYCVAARKETLLHECCYPAESLARLLVHMCRTHNAVATIALPQGSSIIIGGAEADEAGVHGAMPQAAGGDAPIADADSSAPNVGAASASRGGGGAHAAHGKRKVSVAEALRTLPEHLGETLPGTSLNFRENTGTLGPARRHEMLRVLAAAIRFCVGAIAPMERPEDVIALALNTDPDAISAILDLADSTRRSRDRVSVVVGRVCRALPSLSFILFCFFTFLMIFSLGCHAPG